jgi:hypothetical protein
VTHKLKEPVGAGYAATMCGKTVPYRQTTLSVHKVDCSECREAWDKVCREDDDRPSPKSDKH